MHCWAGILKREKRGGKGEKIRTQQGLGNAPAASLEKEEEDAAKLGESDYEEAGSVHGDYGDNSIDVIQEDADESKCELIDIDPVDALVDDDYIPLDDDENIAIEDGEREDVIDSDNDSSEPSEADVAPRLQPN